MGWFRHFPLFVLTVALLMSFQAQACECVSFSDDEEAALFIGKIARADGALEGVVTRSSEASFSGGVVKIRPTRVWFGEKRKQYLIQSGSMCDSPLRQGEKVKLLLFPLPQDGSLLGWIGYVLRAGEPLYAAEACSNFSLGLMDPRVRKALEHRARQPG